MLFVPGRLVTGFGSGGGVCSHFTLVLLRLVRRRLLADVRDYVVRIERFLLCETHLSAVMRAVNLLLCEWARLWSRMNIKGRKKIQTQFDV